MRSRLTFHPSRSSSTLWAIRGWILKNQVLWQRASSSKTKLELSPAPSGCPTLAVHRLRLQMKQRHARICKMASKSHSSFKNLWNMFIIQNQKCLQASSIVDPGPWRTKSSSAPSPSNQSCWPWVLRDVESVYWNVWPQSRIQSEKLPAKQVLVLCRVCWQFSAGQSLKSLGFTWCFSDSLFPHCSLLWRRKTSGKRYWQMQTFAAFEDAAKVVVCFRAGRAILLPAKVRVLQELKSTSGGRLWHAKWIRNMVAETLTPLQGGIWPQFSRYVMLLYATDMEAVLCHAFSCHSVILSVSRGDLGDFCPCPPNFHPHFSLTVEFRRWGCMLHLWHTLLRDVIQSTDKYDEDTQDLNHVRGTHPKRLLSVTPDYINQSCQS